ncbi:MAG: FAD:protein FMN transferase [Candidatus Omnitrophica bacterium]|nr:FAD:protein FMN transferase [Candidatus Omnitrophota bacterium]
MTAIVIIGCAAVAAYFTGCNNTSTGRLYSEKRVAMGTFVEVISPESKALYIAFDEIRRIEKLLSKYDQNSEISQLNRHGRLKASPETFYIVKRAKEFYSLTNGAFDITVGPLMDLWGFTEKKYSVPSERKIKSALKLIGSDKIILHEKDSVIQFKLSGMKIDLGAIAKGYAVDCAVKKLKEAGIKSCLINAGGQVDCLGSRFSKPWKVALKNPRGLGVTDYLELKNKAVSTSGNYEQSFKDCRKDYGHIFDPKTGSPKETDILSVTVIAFDSLTADALSTAIFALGKEKGELLISKLTGIEVKIIEK